VRQSTTLADKPAPRAPLVEVKKKKKKARRREKRRGG
jgi:hypothetical protein